MNPSMDVARDKKTPSASQSPGRRRNLQDISSAAAFHDDSEKEHLRRRIYSLKRCLSKKLKERKPVSFMQYGSITLIDTVADHKLDSQIDGYPAIRPASSWDQNDVPTVDDDDHEHFQKRVHSLRRNLSKKMKNRPKNLHLERFGDITLINRDSLIESLPQKTSAALGPKRTKPRKYRNNTRSFQRADSFRAKEILLDGDIQSIRKCVLERKLQMRPRVVDNVEDCHLVSAIKQAKSKMKFQPETFEPQYNHHHHHCHDLHIKRTQYATRSAVPTVQSQQNDHCSFIQIMPSTA